MEERKQQILFLRNAEVFANYEAAIAGLDSVAHKVGQPVVAIYTDGDDTKLLVAVGKVAGTGAGKYELLANNTDAAALLATLTELAGKFNTHEAQVATADKLGHIKAGGDIAVSEAGVVTVPELENKAPLESPELTGTPLAPTAAAGTDTTQIATTAFVQKAVNDKLASLASAMVYKGTIGTDGDVTALPSDAEVGDTYIATAGAPDVNDMPLEPGDMVIFLGDGKWSVIQTNINGAVTGPTSSLNGNVAVFDGTTGKVIKDSGIDPSTLALKATKIEAGEGLSGSGTLAADTTISHGAAPAAADGTEVGGEGDYVSGVKIDKFGHIAEVTKATLPTESGKVKVSASDTSDFLENKFGEAEVDGNEVAVEFSKADNKIVAKVTIDVIDGGTY